jgi:hypothetical protein
MNLTPLSTSVPDRSSLAMPSITAPALSDATALRDNDERELFSSVIARASRAPGASKEADARTAAEGLVTAALVQPIFKQLRESAGAAPPPFGPGPGERSFRGMLDTTIAQKLVTSQNWPLVDRLARDLLNRSGTGPPLTNPPAKSSSQSTPLPVLTSSDAAR